MADKTLHWSNRRPGVYIASGGRFKISHWGTGTWILLDKSTGKKMRFDFLRDAKEETGVPRGGWERRSAGHYVAPRGCIVEFEILRQGVFGIWVLVDNSTGLESRYDSLAEAQARAKWLAEQTPAESVPLPASFQLTAPIVQES